MIKISMHEETITTIQVDEAWLIANGLPTDLDELSSWDHQTLFEAIDSAIDSEQVAYEYEVPEREFIISRCSPEGVDLW